MFKLNLVKLMSRTNLFTKIKPIESIYSTRLLSNSTNQTDLKIELYKNYGEESIEQKRSRLCYQSRKRGMLENGLLLGCFAGKYLNGFNQKELDEYDHLINQVSNDWDLYYWAVGKNEVPDQFNNSVFKLLKEFSTNELRETRISQPPLH